MKRRNLRRPAKFDDYSVDFANSQYIRQIKRCTLAESDYSSSPASDGLLTSRGLSDRPLIGQCICLGQEFIDEVNNSESLRILSQLSDNFRGDNLVNGKLTFSEYCDLNGGLFSNGDRISSSYEGITVVPLVATGTSSACSFTNTSVDAHHLPMARTKQTAKKSGESRQPGVRNAVKEFTCFVCQWTTEWPNNLKRHLARIHKLREDGTVASPSYCDSYANKRSLKWQQEHAVAKDENGADKDVEPCTPPVANKQKVKNLRRVGYPNEQGLVGVGETHTIPLSRKIETAHISANFSARDVTKANGGIDTMLAQVTVPAHSATLSLPATDIQTYAYDNIEMLLNEEVRAQEDATAVQGLFDLGLSDPNFVDLSAVHDVNDIPLGLGWRWDTPPVMMDDVCAGTGSVVAQADRTAKAGAKVDPVITKALKTKGAQGATTPQRVVSSILNTLIDDVVYASPEALVGSILEDLVAKAVPRPLPPPKKKRNVAQKKEESIDPGTKPGSATPAEISSRPKSNDQKVATKQRNSGNTDNVQSDDALVSVRFDKGPRVAHVPLNVAGMDPTVRKPCVPQNPAPRFKTGTADASVGNVDASSRRKVATTASKQAEREFVKQSVVNASMTVTKTPDKVAQESDVKRMNVHKTPSTHAKVAHNVRTMPSKTSAMRADPSFLAPVAIPRVVQSPPVASRKYLPRKTVAKYAWKLDRSTADVAVMLKYAY